MSEEFEGAASGASAGAAIGTAIAPGIGTLIGGAIGAIAGLFSGRSARKAKKRAQRAADRATATQMVHQAYETGRVNRSNISSERPMYASAGVSSSSGSAQAMERDVMVESIYQQEALLAGLPKKHHWWKNPMRHIEMRNAGKHYRPRGNNWELDQKQRRMMSYGSAFGMGDWSTDLLGAKLQRGHQSVRI